MQYYQTCSPSQFVIKKNLANWNQAFYQQTLERKSTPSQAIIGISLFTVIRPTHLLCTMHWTDTRKWQATVIVELNFKPKMSERLTFALRSVSSLGFDSTCGSLWSQSLWPMQAKHKVSTLSDAKLTEVRIQNRFNLDCKEFSFWFTSTCYGVWWLHILG